MTDAKKKLIAKIKALLNMTRENGASEAEMAFALKRAKAMMDEHDLSASDLDLNGEGVTVETKVVTDFDRIRGVLYTPVGGFCHCKSWAVGKGSDTITFAGLESETIFAHWLLDMLADFVLFSLKSHGDRLGRRVTRREREAFIHGCADRIAARLVELTPRPVPGRGRDLIVLRDQLIDAELDKRGIKLRDNFKLYRLDPKMYAAGEEAGDRAQFNRPVDGMQERRLLS